MNTNSLFPLEPGKTTDLHSRLVANAENLGLVDVAYRIVDSPIGPLLLAATDRGLVRVAFECEDFNTVLESLSTKISPRILEAPSRLDAVAQQLDEYFAGRRQGFDVPLDHALSAGFRHTVQKFLKSIDYGHTMSYKQIAESVGNPKAVRAVGTACATNPLPVVVPCHRVLRSDGSLGGYLGGVEAKTTLLSLERAA
ncbi:methylated-DNA--[protein]-cysteine S-methyltransferase [Corynebacterium sp. L4756]|uniref:methylated-DNA--[protein]-cysteine S-methyltransferase n=1 Tax=unclassified Corynebacterium TaxID=2624378 RepID=UPI00374D09BD